MVAFTAAAAAALLGGVTDTTGLSKPDDGIDDGVFNGVEDSGLLDHDTCGFDNNDHQLDASMLGGLAYGNNHTLDQSYYCGLGQ